MDDPAQRAKIAQELFGDQPVGAPPGNWPPPSEPSRVRANAESQAAARAACRHIRALGIKHFSTTLRDLPRVRVAWQPLRSEQAVPPAPLVYSLIATDGWRVLVTLAAYAFPRRMRRIFNEDIQRQQFRRLNVFAALEVELWRLAGLAGYALPPPYAVRYDLARWLWHPSVTGVIFCLRCGDELRYERRQRGDAERVGRCRACSRGGEDDWPVNAVEPHRRGTWLMRCAHPACQELFVGSRQRHWCDRHRLNRLTLSKRARLV